MLIALLATLAAGVSSCGWEGPAADASPKVVLIGWDGATWKVIRPMLARGELPVLARLIARGERGVLAARPPLLSPVVWTTIATGFPASAHGITGFLLPSGTGGDPILASSFHRRRAALWQMVSAAGKKVGFVGWWSTWPAEPVDGYIVSDHLAYNRWDDWAERGSGPKGGGSLLTYPRELASEMAAYAVRPETVGPDTIHELAAFNQRELRHMMEADAPVMYDAPSVVRYGYATDASNQSFALHLLDTRDQPDLFALVYILSDVAGHVLWHHYRPERFPGFRPDDDRLRDAIPAVYRQLDAWTGEILERIDPDSLVIVLSDHGMQAAGVLPQPGVNPAGAHTRKGIFVVSGPGLPDGTELGSLAQVDVAPTVLAMLDLPVARDMPGHIVRDALPVGSSEEPDRIDSYGTGHHQAPSSTDSPGGKDYEARLKALGYIR